MTVSGDIMDAQTHDRLAAMERRLDDGQKTFDAVRQDVGDIKIALVRIEALATRASDDHRSLREWAVGHEGRIAALEQDAATRKGERGVWTAMLKSPAIAWLAAAAAGIWAFLSHGGVSAK